MRTKIDPGLFQILETFLNDWKSFDYNDTDPITGNYHSLLFDFIENLENGHTGNYKIITTANTGFPSGGVQCFG